MRYCRPTPNDAEPPGIQPAFFESGPARNDSRWKRACFASLNALRSCAPTCESGPRGAEVLPRQIAPTSCACPGSAPRISANQKRGRRVRAAPLTGRESVCRRCAFGASAPRPRRGQIWEHFWEQNSAKHAQIDAIRRNDCDRLPPLISAYAIRRHRQNPWNAAHNPEVAGSNPVPATSRNGPRRSLRGPFSCRL